MSFYYICQERTKASVNGKNITDIFSTLGIEKGNKDRFLKNAESIECGMFDINSIKSYFSHSITIYKEKSDGQLAGICFFKIKTKNIDYIEIGLLCVPNRETKSGIGKTLLKRLFIIANIANCKIILYSIPETIRYYEKNKFTIIERDPDTDYYDEYYEGITEMEYTPKKHTTSSVKSKRVRGKSSRSSSMNKSTRRIHSV